MGYVAVTVYTNFRESKVRLVVYKLAFIFALSKVEKLDSIAFASEFVVSIEIEVSRMALVQSIVIAGNVIVAFVPII